MANTTDKSTKNTANSTTSVAASNTASESGQTQVYFVPEYNVSVEATSNEEAVAKAKEIKGVK